MKVRDKRTGEIFEIASYAKVPLEVCDSRGTPIELNFEDIELIDDALTDSFDWESFRRETAKSAMLSIIKTAVDKDFIYPDPEEVGAMAVLYAEELIRELKDE